MSLMGLPEQVRFRMESEELDVELDMGHPHHRCSQEGPAETIRSEAPKDIWT